MLKSNQPRIQSLLATVRIYGDRNMLMRTWVDSNKVAAHDLTVQDIEEDTEQNQRFQQVGLRPVVGIS